MGKRLRIALAVFEVVLGIAGVAIGILAFFQVSDCPDTVPECEHYVRSGGRLLLFTGVTLVVAGLSAGLARNRSIVVEQFVVLFLLTGLWTYFGQA